MTITQYSQQRLSMRKQCQVLKVKELIDEELVLIEQAELPEGYEALDSESK